MFCRNPDGSYDSSFMLVFLADMELQRLPLEALALLRENPNISGFSRDFSLQMFHNRFGGADASSDDAGVGEDGKEKKGKGDKGKGSKNQKESKRPQVKVSNLDREIAHGYVAVDLHGFSYVVDPLKEASEYDEFKPETALGKYLDDVTFQNKYLARWMGILGGDKMPT